MFGFFGKSGFDSEMAELDKKHKAIGNEILIAMNSFQIKRQADLVLQMAEICNQKAQCCKRHGKLEDMRKWEDAKQKALQLHG